MAPAAGIARARDADRIRDQAKAVQQQVIGEPPTERYLV